MGKIKICALIPTYENSKQPYLDLCLESLRRQSNSDYEVSVIVASGCKEPPKVLPGVKVLNFPRDYSAAKNVTLASKEVPNDVEFLILGNDDLIFSKNSVSILADLSLGKDIIVNPTSNCDLGIYYHSQFQIQNMYGGQTTIPQQLRLEEFKPFTESLMNSQWSYPFPLLFPVDYVCTYATMIRKSTFDKLGYDYENLEVFGVDNDLCWRAKDLGVQSYISFNTFVLHFGGVTHNDNLNDEKRRKQFEIFKKKYPNVRRL